MMSETDLKLLILRQEEMKNREEFVKRSTQIFKGGKGGISGIFQESFMDIPPSSMWRLLPSYV